MIVFILLRRYSPSFLFSERQLSQFRIIYINNMYNTIKENFNNRIKHYVYALWIILTTLPKSKHATYIGTIQVI